MVSNLADWNKAIILFIIVIFIFDCHKNNPPDNIVITVSRTSVESEDTVFAKASAEDRNGDSIFFKWSATGGSFDDTDNDSVIWIASTVNEIVQETLSVRVFDIHRDTSIASITISVFPKGGIWVTKTSMPTKRGELGAVAVGDKIYAIGGSYEQDTLIIITNIVEIYDTKTATWTQGPSMPTPRARMAVVAMDNKIYVIGGTNGDSVLAINEVYDITTNSWTNRASMPTPRCGAAAATINGKIYIIGGWNNGVLSINEEYDPVTDLWIQKSPMPTPRTYSAAAVYKGKIYVVGGYSSYFCLCNEVYEPVADSWEAKSPMQVYRDALALVEYKGRLFAIGGRDMLPGEGTDFNEMYNPDTDEWIFRARMPTARYFLGAVGSSGGIYVIGGFEGWYASGKNEVYFKP